MSGNFAIKGGGRTPNGKCHPKFPFWFFEPFPYISCFFEQMILEVDVSSTAGKRRRRRRLARERCGQARGGTQGADQVGQESYTPPPTGVKPIFSVTRKFDPRCCSEQSDKWFQAVFKITDLGPAEIFGYFRTIFLLRGHFCTNIHEILG